MATSRTDFMGLDFMVESTYGVANGTDIVAAGYSSESSDDYLASTTKKVFARMAAPPSGFPTVPMVEVEHVKQTHNYANKKVKGLQSEGELTFSLHMHGPTHDSPDDYPVPPPWMQMITSAVGAMGGHVAGMGGAETSIDGTGTSSSQFNITAGDVFSGGMIAVDGPATGTNIEFTRITDITGSNAVKVFLDCIPPLSGTPVTADKVYHTNQVWFDEREESESGTFQNPSFTVLLHRSHQDSAVIFRGFKVTSFKITDTVGEIPTIELTGQYSSYSIEGDGGSQWSGYTGISSTMATTASVASAYNYSSIWPEPEVCKDANLAYDASGTRTTIETKGFELTWESGLQKFMSNNAAEGVSALNATGVPKVTFTVTPLYSHSYRAFMGSEIAGLMYSRGGGKGKLFAVHIASGVLQEDPTLDGDADGNQAQTLTFDAGYYNGDKEGGAVVAYTAGEPTQNRFSIAVA